MLNPDQEPMKTVPYIDLEFVMSYFGKERAIDVYWRKHRVEPDVILKKRMGNRYSWDWLMGNVKVER
jgi:hypothetical protein